MKQLMIKKFLCFSLFILFLFQDCKPTEVCNINDSAAQCGLDNILVQTSCGVTSLPPSKPQNLSGSPSNGQIELNWNPVHCSSHYNVYWSVTPNINILTANKIISQSTNLTHTGLINGITYYYAVAAENSLNQKEGVLSEEVFFTPAMKTLKTYVTAVTYSIPSIGSIAGADTICNNDSGKPVGGSFYKALLVDETGCIGSTPCRRASITANIGDGQIDWVFKPNTNYVRSDGVTPIMTTNVNGLFIFGTLTNGWTSAALTGISGMSGTWVTFAGLTCTNYSLNSGSVTTTQYQQTGSVSLSNATLVCANPYYLLCIEQ